MKKIFCATIVIFISFLSLNLLANGGERKGTLRFGGYMPGLFVGNKGIDAMMSFGADGEYYLLENLAANFRLEEATDFKAGGPPHSVFTFLARARYILDIGTSGRWSAYVQAGGGGGLIGSDHACGDVAVPGGGVWYQWNDNLSFGVDSSMHILVRDTTAVAFGVSPVVRYQF